MGWKVYGDWFSTAEMSNTSKFQKVTFDKNIILRAVRVWLIFYNSPVFTNLTMKIYTDNGGVPGDLLYNSTSRPSADYADFSPNGVADTYFEFAEVPLKTDVYHFIINASGYTGTSATHIAWKKAYPDPLNTSGLTVNPIKLGVLPFTIAFIDSEQK